MTFSSDNLIGGARVPGSGTPWRAVEAATGASLEPSFASATVGQAEHACALAADAFDAYRATPPSARAALLEAIADAILDLGDELVTRCMAETGLPRPRIEGERGRTVGQLRMFAAVVRSGAFLGARIDTAQPERTPLPRPDLRLCRIAVGPVLVFGASNFPLAFSVAGGDTASALAAGCPVIVKAHPAHPGTSALVGDAVRRAVTACGLPDGVFALLFEEGIAIGQHLAADPRVAAIGFTGSRRAGTALMRIAAARPVPIPVFAEMSSINPVILMPAALAARGAEIGRAFVASLTLGAGQFCTSPGLVLGVESPGLAAFEAAAADALSGVAAAAMLTPGIHRAYREGVAALEGNPAVARVAQGQPGTAQQGRPILFATTGAAFRADHRLAAEVFGAASLVVRCRDAAELRTVLEGLEGQLTASLHLGETDHAAARGLVPLLERKVGRILVNGFGTGVEVGHAMVHGGPFPATSDGRTTSVGSLAIDRFLRPVCYQDVPEALLPAALTDANPWRLPRSVDGAAPGA
ncbi:MAG: aldehyde dehydrogenase (NADP(+)) [Parafilimonas terrae]|nr:aldehyde dehydrogenase (NADP(+)) [Parafilimonas terrae]